MTVSWWEKKTKEFLSISVFSRIFGEKKICDEKSVANVLDSDGDLIWKELQNFEIKWPICTILAIKSSRHNANTTGKSNERESVENIWRHTMILVYPIRLNGDDE